MEAVTDMLRDLLQGVSIHDAVIWLEVGNPSGRTGQASPAVGEAALLRQNFSRKPQLCLKGLCTR